MFCLSCLPVILKRQKIISEWSKRGNVKALHCRRKSNCVIERGSQEWQRKYVKLVQNVCEESETVVRCAVDVTDELKVGVRLHQE